MHRPRSSEAAGRTGRQEGSDGAASKVRDRISASELEHRAAELRYARAPAVVALPGFEDDGMEAANRMRWAWTDAHFSVFAPPTVVAVVTRYGGIRWG